MTMMRLEEIMMRKCEKRKCNAGLGTGHHNFRSAAHAFITVNINLKWWVSLCILMINFALRDKLKGKRPETRNKVMSKKCYIFITIHIHFGYYVIKSMWLEWKSRSVWHSSGAKVKVIKVINWWKPSIDQLLNTPKAWINRSQCW